MARAPAPGKPPRSLCRKVLPGAVVYDFSTAHDGGQGGETRPPSFGPGLMLAQNTVLAIKAGTLVHYPDSNTYLVQSDQMRYVPSLGENVIGVIVQKTAEAFRVDIGAAHTAILSFMAFENASKRNRINLNVGDIVLARVAVADRDMEPEIECVRQETGKSDGFGLLGGGYVFKCSLGLCRKLMFADCAIYSALDECFKYELALGLNGRIWIQTKFPHATLLIEQAIRQTYKMRDSDARDHISKLAAQLKSDSTAA